MNKNIILIILCLSILPTVLALNIDTIYKNQPILLSEGWNGVSIIPDYDNLVKGDFDIDLVSDTSGYWNLIGTSFITRNNKCRGLNILTFTDSNGNSLRYRKAIKAGWISPLDVSRVCPNKAIWIKSFEAVSVTISNVKGSPVGETFDWSNLRFSNGIEELGIIDAMNAAWIQGYLQYWDENLQSFQYLSEGESRGVPYLNTISSWQGLMVYSYQDNIYLITDNTKQIIKSKNR